MVVTCTSMVRFESIITPIFLALGDRPMTSSQIVIEDKDGQGRWRADNTGISVLALYLNWTQTLSCLLTLTLWCLFSNSSAKRWLRLLCLLAKNAMFKKFKFACSTSSSFGAIPVTMSFKSIMYAGRVENVMDEILCRHGNLPTKLLVDRKRDWIRNIFQRWILKKQMSESQVLERIFSGNTGSKVLVILVQNTGNTGSKRD